MSVMIVDQHQYLFSHLTNVDGRVIEYVGLPSGWYYTSIKPTRQQFHCLSNGLIWLKQRHRQSSAFPTLNFRNPTTVMRKAYLFDDVTMQDF